MAEPTYTVATALAQIEKCDFECEGGGWRAYHITPAGRALLAGEQDDGTHPPLAGEG